MKRCEVNRDELSPMMKQYMEIKDQYEDELFRKLGYDPVTKTFVKGGK